MFYYYEVHCGFKVNDNNNNISPCPEDISKEPMGILYVFHKKSLKTEHNSSGKMLRYFASVQYSVSRH
jgi:hypothetical protein